MAKKTKDNPEHFPLIGRKLLWLDNMKNVDKIVYGLYITCALLFVADFVYKKKSYLDIEDLPGFYAIYGFVMCALLVICARGMRVFLMRDETYYAPNDVESEAHPDADMSQETNP